MIYRVGLEKYSDNLNRFEEIFWYIGLRPEKHLN